MQRKQKRKRRAYTAAELAEVWDRWQRGEPSDGLARALNRGTNVYTLLARFGGIRPRTRHRSARLPTVIIRPGGPNAAASSFASGLFREPLAGETCELTVKRSQRVPVIGYRPVVEGFVGWHEAPPCRLGDDRPHGLRRRVLALDYDDELGHATILASARRDGRRP